MGIDSVEFNADGCLFSPDDRIFRNARPADERSANRHTLQYPIIEELIIARRYTEERPANLYGKLNLACRTPGASVPASTRQYS